MANEIHKLVRLLTNVKDPYEVVKKESNDLVLGLYPRLKIMIEESVDPIRTAIKLAIVGNIIDYGALREFDLDKTIKEVMERPLAARALPLGVLFEFTDDSLFQSLI